MNKPSAAAGASPRAAFCVAVFSILVCERGGRWWGYEQAANIPATLQFGRDKMALAERLRTGSSGAMVDTHNLPSVAQ